MDCSAYLSWLPVEVLLRSGMMRRNQRIVRLMLRIARVMAVGATVACVALPEAAIAEGRSLPARLNQPLPPLASTQVPEKPKKSLTLPLAISSNQSVEVLVVGAQPTQKLRIRAVAGSRQRLRLVWQLATQIKVGERRLKALPLPEMTATLDVQIIQVDRNGDIHSTIAYRDVGLTRGGRDVSPMTKKLLQQQLQPLEGLTGKYVVSTIGMLKSGEIVAPQSLSALQQSLIGQVFQSVSHLSVPLPTMPIGVGSQWQQTIPVEVNGITVSQKTTYELMALKDGIATIKSRFSQSAMDQQFKPGVKGFGDLQVKSLNSTGTGQMVWDIRTLMPSKSSIQMTSDIVSQPLAIAPGQVPPVIESRSAIQFQVTQPK
ncbi:hypothetical protein [Romeriopsis navalis]|uniref:hypothetical protein n=1 Tax=Romeriopsis navalis TaxID=2992132 RepID=UPI0021F82D9E|nr:hypothetical protein [Romeriopsis navalis]